MTASILPTTVNLSADSPCPRTLVRTFTLVVAFSLALLAPGVAAAVGFVGFVGGAPVPGADDMLPSGVQSSPGQATSATALRKTAAQSGVASLPALQPVGAPRSLERSSLSAQRGPPPLRGPPAVALR